VSKLKRDAIFLIQTQNLERILLTLLLSLKSLCSGRPQAGRPPEEPKGKDRSPGAIRDSFVTADHAVASLFRIFRAWALHAQINKLSKSSIEYAGMGESGNAL
jgi:hypothetical protein